MQITLGEICSFTNGGTPKKSVPEYWTGDIPFITGADIDEENGTITEPRGYITEEAISKSSTNLIPTESILLVTRTGVGKIAIPPYPVCVSQDFTALSFDPKVVHQRYLFHVLRSAKESFVRQARGATIQGITREVVSSFRFDIPPLKEQKRIADILDKADEIKHNIHKMKDIKKQTELSLFLDMFGDPVANSKGWNVQKLGQITDGIRSGSTPKGGSKNYVEDGITFFRSQNVWRNMIEFSDVAYIDEKMHSSMKKTSLKKNDILITKTGRINTENSSLGRAALFTGEDDTANINGHVYFIRLNDSSFLHEFVVYILTTDIFREYIRSVCVGGIDKRQLNKDHIENFPIISPSLDLQKKFISKIKQLSSLTKNSRINLPITLSYSVTQEMLT